jgi:uncharacterized membrane protein YgaE (UPF0421/DUF939 family)
MFTKTGIATIITLVATTNIKIGKIIMAGIVALATTSNIQSSQRGHRFGYSGLFGVFSISCFMGDWSKFAKECLIH